MSEVTGTLDALAARLGAENPVFLQGYLAREFILKMAAVIRAMRKAAGFTQENFANLLGVPLAQLNSVEEGNEEANLTVKLLARAAIVCGQSLTVTFAKT